MFDLFKLTATQWNEVPNMLIAQLRGWGFEGDDENAEPVDDAPFMQQLGVAVFPIVRSTLRGLGWRHGDEVWMLKVWDKARKLFDMEKGETRIYAVGDENTRIRFRQNGEVNLDAAQIKLGEDATLRASRETDPTVNGTLSFEPGPFPGTLQIRYVPAQGAPQIVTITFASTAGVTVATAPGSALELSGEIRGGSEKVKIA